MVDKPIDLQKLAKNIESLKKRKEKKESNEKINLKGKVVSKGVVKQTKATLHIKEHKPAEYVPLYFQAELDKTKQDMGFWK